MVRDKICILCGLSGQLVHHATNSEPIRFCNSDPDNMYAPEIPKNKIELAMLLDVLITANGATGESVRLLVALVCLLDSDHALVKIAQDYLVKIWNLENVKEVPVQIITETGRRAQQLAVPVFRQEPFQTHALVRPHKIHKVVPQILVLTVNGQTGRCVHQLAEAACSRDANRTLVAVTIIFRKNLVMKILDHMDLGQPGQSVV